MEESKMNDEFTNSGVAGEVVTQSTVSNKKKVVAAVLCFFLGSFGVHRFYLGQAGSGAVMLVLELIGWLTTGIFIGFALLVVTGIWSVIDFFRILFNGMTDAQGRKLA